MQAYPGRSVLWCSSVSGAHDAAQQPQLKVNLWVDSQAACSRAEHRWGGDKQGPAPACLSLQGQIKREIQSPFGVTGDRPNPKPLTSLSPILLTASVGLQDVQTKHMSQ